MKNLKIKTIATTFALSAIALTANAQRQPQGRPGMGGEKLEPEKIAEKQTDKLDQELELTDAQEKKIYSIYLSAAQEAKEKRESLEKREKPEKPEEGDKKTKEERAEEMKARKDEKLATLKAVMAVLDDDQKIDFAILLSKKDNNRPQGRNPRMQGQRPQGQGMQQGKQQGQRPQGQGMQQGKRPEGQDMQQGKQQGQRPQGPRPMPQDQNATEGETTK